MTAEPAVATKRELHSFIRTRRRAHARKRRSDRWLDIYMGLFLAGYGVLAVAGTIDASGVARPENLATALEWLPVVLLVALWGVLRFGTWQGPVLFPPPTLHWLFSAPIDRRALVRVRLRRAFTVASGIGIVTGLTLGVAAEALLGRGFLAVFTAATCSIGAFALLATALSWHVERSRRWTGVVARGGLGMLVILAAAGGLVSAGREAAVVWSGPWGWAAAPIASAADQPFVSWIAPTVLLAVAATAAVFSAIARADQISEETLWDRARTHSSASAALFFGDVRTIATIARRQRQRGTSRSRTAGLPRVRPPSLVIAARDLAMLRRTPAPFAGAAVVFGGIGFAAGVGALDRPILSIGAFVAFYLAASRLLEPLRIEADVPDAHLLLPWPWGKVALLHCILPITTLTVLGWIGLAVVGVGGWLPAGEIRPLVALVPLAAAAMVTSAAVSALRRPFPIEKLLGGAETGALSVIGWLVVGPLVAAVSVDIAANILRGTSASAGSPLGAAAVLAFGGGATAVYLRTRRAPA